MAVDAVLALSKFRKGGKEISKGVMQNIIQMPEMPQKPKVSKLKFYTHMHTSLLLRNSVIVLDWLFPSPLEEISSKVDILESKTKRDLM